MQEGPWWFSVKYGEDKTALFNMDCWSCTLIAHVSSPPGPLPACHGTSHTQLPSQCRRAQIKEKCGYEELTEDIDLQKDVGGMVELHTHGRASARELLTPKATYILCKMAVAEDAPEGTAPTPELLWTPPEGYVAPAAAPPKKK